MYVHRYHRRARVSGGCYVNGGSGKCRCGWWRSWWWRWEGNGDGRCQSQVEGKGWQEGWRVRMRAEDRLDSVMRHEKVIHKCVHLKTQTARPDSEILLECARGRKRREFCEGSPRHFCPIHICLPSPVSTHALVEYDLGIKGYAPSVTQHVAGSSHLQNG